jgi:hypothetical protein
LIGRNAGSKDSGLSRRNTRLNVSWAKKKPQKKCFYTQPSSDLPQVLWGRHLSVDFFSAVTMPSLIDFAQKY